MERKHCSSFVSSYTMWWLKCHSLHSPECVTYQYCIHQYIILHFNHYTDPVQIMLYIKYCYSSLYVFRDTVRDLMHRIQEDFLGCVCLCVRVCSGRGLPWCRAHARQTALCPTGLRSGAQSKCSAWIVDRSSEIGLSYCNVIHEFYNTPFQMTLSLSRSLVWAS